MGSGAMANDIKYRRISGIKLPLLFRICFFTAFIQNAKKETPIYKLLVQIYYQMGNEFFVGTYSDKDRKYINKILQCNYKEYLDIKEGLYFEENVLYDFVESESNDFYDFLD